MGLTGFLLVGAILSRIGLLNDVSWLRMEPPGPLTLKWGLEHVIATAVGGLVAGVFCYAVVRFPDLRDRSSPG